MTINFKIKLNTNLNLILKIEKKYILIYNNIVNINKVIYY